MDTVENHIKDTAQYRLRSASVIQADNAKGKSVDQGVGKPVQHFRSQEQGRFSNIDGQPCTQSIKGVRNRNLADNVKDTRDQSENLNDNLPP